MKHIRTAAFILLMPAALIAAPSGEWSDIAHQDPEWNFPPHGTTNYIDTPAQLARFAHLINNGSHTDSTVLITNDIDLAAHFWFPAGNWDNPFRGTLAAIPGIAIRNMTVTNCNVCTNIGAAGAGLFGYIGSGGVQSLTLANARVTLTHANATVYAGIIAGWIHGGTIADCSADGTVTAATTSASPVCAGGIVGKSIVATLVGCSADTAVTATATYIDNANAGGIAGANAFTLANCSSRGTATAYSATGWAIAGGIAGKSEAGSFIANCESRSDASATGREYGAIAGGIAGTSIGTLANCVSLGTVTATAPAENPVSAGVPTRHVGAIAGRNYGTVTACYWNKNATDLPATDPYHHPPPPQGVHSVAIILDPRPAIACGSFTAPPGTVNATRSLIPLLNAWVALLNNAWGTTTRPPTTVTYVDWTLATSRDGYPTLTPACRRIHTAPSEHPSPRIKPIFRDPSWGLIP